MAFSPNGRLLASSASDRTIRLWDASSGAAVRVLRVPGADAGEVAWTPDGKGLVASTRDRAIHLWSLEQPDPVKTLARLQMGGYGLAISADGKRITSAGWDQHAVRVWDIEGKVDSPRALRFLGHQDLVTGLQFSPDGRLLASGGVDKTVRLWRTGVDPATLTRGARGGAPEHGLGGGIQPGRQAGGLGRT